MGRAAERRLVQQAARQCGVVSAADVAACRLSRKTLRRRLETGEWTKLHRRIFKLGLNEPGVDELEMAAILAAGDGAVLSHITAARRLGLDVPREDSVQISIPVSRAIRKLGGVRVWRSRRLLDSDTTNRGPFRVTNLARTMIDLASVLDDGWLRAALDSALRRRRSHLGWIWRVLAQQGNGRRGVERLHRLLRESEDEDEVSDSVLESLGMELAAATGRKPKLHERVIRDGRLIAEVDFAWPEVQLCAQLDGWKYHGTRTAFVRDRAGDRALARLGWMVLRYTWQDVTSDRESMIEELLGAYHSRAQLLRSSRHRRRHHSLPE